MNLTTTTTTTTTTATIKRKMFSNEIHTKYNLLFIKLLFNHQRPLTQRCPRHSRGPICFFYLQSKKQEQRFVKNE